MYSRIAGTGSYLPEKIVSNFDLEKTMDTTDEWIRTRTGIERRHIAAEGQTTVDLAEIAARRAIEAAGITPAEVDFIVFGTTTPDLVFPNCGTLLQARLGARGCPAFSVETACSHARNTEIENRVSFEVASATSYPTEGFDLICFFDCLHDMGDPVGAARHAKGALADDGTVMLVEPFANDRVEENLNVVGRLYYSASTTLCCAHSLSENGAAALGAQAGEARLAGVFTKAGFGEFRKAKATPFNLILEAKV